MENGHHRKAENKLYQGTNHYTTHQMHILKQNDYYRRKNRGLYISTRSRNPIGSCELLYLDDYEYTLSNDLIFILEWEINNRI